VIFDNLSLQPQALFRLKSLCEALGIEADGATDLDFDDFVGQEVLVDVENETYEGKKRARAAGYASLEDKDSSEDGEEEEEAEDEDEDADDEAEDEDEDDEEDEKPARKKKSVKKTSKAKDEEEDEDEDEDEDDSEEEEEESEDEDEDEDEEERPTKKRLGKVKGKVSTGLVKGAKVSFKDGKKTIRGTVVSIKNKTARIEDKNGDEYDVPSEQVELL
jgi:hypothetical protein